MRSADAGRTGTGPRSRARHGAESDYDPHNVEVERFAKQLLAPTRRIVTREIDRDLVHADDRLIRREAFATAR